LLDLLYACHTLVNGTDEFVADGALEEFDVGVADETVLGNCDVVDWEGDDVGAVEEVSLELLSLEDVDELDEVATDDDVELAEEDVLDSVLLDPVSL
jgi:hypothetical protein